jgi:hypothetical protein
MTQAPPSWFDKQPGEPDDESFQRRKADLLKQLPQLLEQRKDRGRAYNFYPYLLVRSLLGDRGDRPFNGCFWESPDIWTAPGPPATSPATPATHGGQVVVGQPNTVYAHVWNLGFAPLAGIRVEFYWFNPSLGIDGSHANLIGMARCELAGRGMAGSHKLVKCPTAWIPVMENGGHECLVVRVSGIGDPIGGNEWAPSRNRHVAQRNISVIAAGARLDQLIGKLNQTRLNNTRLQLIQLGPAEGELARHLAVPNLRLNNAQTHVLAEIDLTGKVILPNLTEVPAGMTAPVHPLAHGGSAPLPQLHAPGETPIVDPRIMFPTLSVAAPSSSSAHLSELLVLAGTLQPGGLTLPPPAAGEAHVLRMASYRGDTLVGGYTLVVQGG